MKNFKFLLPFLLIVFFQKNLQAQSGVIDPTFNNGAIAFGNLNLNSGWTTNVGIQTDGKIISFLGDDTSHIIRFDSDGTIDGTFGTIEIPYRAYSIKILGDDKFLIGGENGIIEKYNGDGTLDNSFDLDIPIDMNVLAMHLQEDGKILSTGSGSQTGNTLARYFSDGTLDTSFGTNGWTFVDIVPKDAPRNVYTLMDGSIIIQGSPLFGASLLGHVIKFTSDGNLDTSFANDGIFELDLGIESYSNSSNELPDGKILIEGMFSDSGISTVFFLRLNPDGTIDSTFGTNGNTADPTFQNGEGFTIPLITNSAILQPDGKFLVNGFTWGSLVNNSRGFGVKRYLSDGTIDNSFGFNGLAYSALLDVNIIDPWLTLDPNGDIIQLGRIDKNGAHDIVAVRYLNDLSLGTLEFENENSSFLVFPNPIDHYCELKFSIPSEKNLTAYLTDVDGKKINTFFYQSKIRSRRT